MNPRYNFTESDVNAITAALISLPSYGFFPSDMGDMAFTLSVSVRSNLLGEKPLSKREVALIALAVDCAIKALRDEMDADAETLERLRPYLFAYNKLTPVFAPFLPL